MYVVPLYICVGSNAFPAQFTLNAMLSQFISVASNAISPPSKLLFNLNAIQYMCYPTLYLCWQCIPPMHSAQPNAIHSGPLCNPIQANAMLDVPVSNVLAS